MILNRNLEFSRNSLKMFRAENSKQMNQQEFLGERQRQEAKQNWCIQESVKKKVRIEFR